MPSIVCMLARAAFATRASPSAVGGIAGGGRPAAAIRVSPAGGLKSEDDEEEEKARPKSQAAPDDAPRRRHLAVDENALTFDEDMWAYYEHFCKIHGISRDRREMELPFKKFSDVVRLVFKIDNSVVDGELSMTRFSDQTKAERMIKYEPQKPTYLRTDAGSGLLNNKAIMGLFKFSQQLYPLYSFYYA
ncbi:hypothetical protein VPH35_061073 [Triticum aestivum]|uniref:Cathepsin propeptide inhibitor domain-containing protein n=1 Tax=Aegilops tauschii TaxID=37682 RepID=M8D2M7_AEGTA